MSDEEIRLECIKAASKLINETFLPSEACIQMAETFYKWVKSYKNTPESDPETDRYLNAARTK